MAVTRNESGTSDGTGLRRAIAVAPPVPVGEEGREEGLASRAGFLPRLGTSAPACDVVGWKMGERVTADGVADMSRVLVERFWCDRTPRGYRCAKDLLVSTRDWRSASSVEEVYTIRTRGVAGGSVFVWF